MKVGDRYTKRCKRYNLAGNAHELTFSCYNGRNFLSKERTCQWLAESIVKARKKLDFALWAYVFMPNHVHLLIRPRKKDYSISAILSEIKKPVARKAIYWVKNNKPDYLKYMATGQTSQQHRFWQQGGGYDRNVTRFDTLLNCDKYIHRNPVRKKLVKIPQDWYFSSAADWKNVRQGPIEIDRKEWPAF